MLGKNKENRPDVKPWKTKMKSKLVWPHFVIMICIFLNILQNLNYNKRALKIINTELFKITYKNGFLLDSPFNFPVFIWSSFVEALTEWGVTFGAQAAGNPWQDSEIRCLTWGLVFIRRKPRHKLVPCAHPDVSLNWESVGQLIGSF